MAPPRRNRRIRGRGTAIALAIVVHALFIAVLVFSVRWQNQQPADITS